MHRYLSTPTIFSAPAGQVDRQNGIIKGVTIAQVGIAKGHGAFIDKAFLLQLVDNAATKPAGIKARFGHPNMCSTALGSYLGRFKNYSYSGNSVTADLYLDDTARNSPSGDLFSYVLDMAEKNPDMFGASIYFQSADSHFQKEEVNGKEVNKEYFRLLDLRGTDIVDEPAATDGLFSATTFPGIATQFLDENPEIAELIFSKPENVIEFFSAYLKHSKMNLSDKIKENFSSFIDAFSVSGNPAAKSDAELIPGSDPAELLASVETPAIDYALAFDTLNAEHQLLLASVDDLTYELAAANERILELTGQLSARPSVPLNVTDPLVSITTGKEVDKTGKELFEALPADAKRILKSK